MGSQSVNKNHTKKQIQVSKFFQQLERFNVAFFSLPILPYEIWDFFFLRISKARFFRKKKLQPISKKGLHHRVHRMILHDLKAGAAGKSTGGAISKDP